MGFMKRDPDWEETSLNSGCMNNWSGHLRSMDLASGTATLPREEIPAKSQKLSFCLLILHELYVEEVSLVFNYLALIGK